MTKQTEAKMKKEEKSNDSAKHADGTECSDLQCPEHGTLSARGRIFEGKVIKKFPKRIMIELERTVYIRKYERYMKKKTKLHARVPSCRENEAQIGDYVQIQECRPLSKIIHFVYIKTIRKGEGNVRENKISGKLQQKPEVSLK